MTWCGVPSHDGRILARGCLPLSWAPDQQSTPGGGSGATPITLVVVEELVVPSWVVLVTPDGTDVLVATAGSARKPAKSRPVTRTTAAACTWASTASKVDTSSAEVHVGGKCA